MTEERRLRGALRLRMPARSLRVYIQQNPSGEVLIVYARHAFWNRVAFQDLRGSGRSHGTP
jgi:hypothetical protein